MAVNIKLKRSSQAGKIPTTSSLELGEIALNTTDGKAFMLKQSGSTQSVIELASTSGSILSASFATFANTAATASYSTTLGASLSQPANNQVRLLASDGSTLSTVTVNNVTSASYALSASFATTASFAENAPNAVSASHAATASSADNFLIRGSATASNLLVNNTITAQTLVVQVITSSIDFVTGSTRFGTLLTDTHQFTGSVSITGSLGINGVDYASTSASFDTRINNLTESVFTHVVTDSGGVFVIDGISRPKLSFTPGATYRFNTSAVGGSHPFKFSTSENGPTQYTTGVISGSNFIQIEINYNTPTTLYYYCTNHSGMGNEINTLRIENLVSTGSFNSFTSSINSATSSLSSSIAALSSSFLSASSSFDSRINSLTESVFTHVVTDSGGVFVIDNVSKPKLSFTPGATYRFNTSAVGGSHPFKFSTSENGPTQYTTGVTSGSNFIQIEINYDTPTTLYYYCTNHSGMGNEISTLRIENLVSTGSFNPFTSSVNTTTASLSSSIAALSSSFLSASSSFDTRINNLTESIFTHVVTNSGASNYIIDGVSKPILSFVPGATYRFNTSGVVGSHPLKFSTSPNGPTQYTTGVISGSNFIQIEVNYDTPTVLYYYCTNHNGMGNEINVLRIDTLTTTSSFNSFTSSINSATSSLSSSIATLSSSFLAFSGSYNTGSFTGSFTGSLNGTASSAVSASFAITASHALNVPATSSFAISASHAATASSADDFIIRQNLTGSNALFSGTITAQTLNVQIITSSIDFITGSTRFGTQLTDTHQFTGSVTITGSLAVNNSNVILTNQTSSMSVATASFASTASFVTLAQTASFVQNAISSSFASTASFVQTAQTASFVQNAVSSSFASTASFVTLAQTASFVQNAQTASFVQNAISSSFASTASFVTLAQTASFVQTAQTASFVQNAISSSFASTASFIELAKSASFAITASFALNAGSGGGGSSTLSILDEGNLLGTASFLDFVGAGVTATVTNGTASINIPGGGGGGGQSGGNAILTQSVASVTWSFTHNLGTQYPVFTIYDNNDDVIIPQRINVVSTSSALIYFSSARTGFAVASQGGDIVSASYAISASHASNSTSASFASTASFVTLAQTASFVTTAQTASFVANAQSASNAVNAITASSADNLLVRGTLTAQTIVVQTITSSINFVTGSTKFGLLSSNTHQFTGSVSVSGSLDVNNSSVILTNQTSSMSVATASFASTASFVQNAQTASFVQDAISSSFASTASFVTLAQTASFVTLAQTASFVQTAQTASFVTTAQTASFVQNAISSSFATTASFALNAGGGGSGAGFPFSGSAIITGSLLVSGSFVDFTQASYVTGSLTGSLLGTASFATSASYAISSSFANFALTASTAPGHTVQFSQSVASATWSFTHNMNTRNPIVQVYDLDYKQIIPNDIIGTSVNAAEIRFDYATTGYVIMSNGGGLHVTGSTSELDQTTASTTWSFTHNLNSKYVNFTVYDSNDFVIIPANIKAIDVNNAELYFAAPQTGRAVAQFSGINGAPNATTASFASTASFLNPVTSGYVVLTQVSQSLNFVDDAAASSSGVPLGGLYRNGNFIMIRIT